jgi:hypothetical protein
MADVPSSAGFINQEHRPFLPVDEHPQSGMRGAP